MKEPPSIKKLSQIFYDEGVAYSKLAYSKFVYRNWSKIHSVESMGRLTQTSECSHLKCLATTSW